MTTVTSKFTVDEATKTKMDVVRADMDKLIKADPTLTAIFAKIDFKDGKSPTRALSDEERMTYFQGKLEPYFQKLSKLFGENIRRNLKS